MEEKNIHWFPGHMVRALREIETTMAIVDVVIEVADARIPQSSRNPYLAYLKPHKKRLLLLAKEDLADPVLTARWVAYFEARDTRALAVDLKNPKSRAHIIEAVQKLAQEKREKEARKGMRPQPIRAMIIGAPNVGKSTLINFLAHRQAAAVEDRPGLTKAQQWIKVADQFELLDTPGVLPSDYEDRQAAIRLAAVGAIKQEILPVHTVAEFILTYLAATHPEALKTRYELTEEDLLDLPHLFAAIALKRGLNAGGIPDMDKGDLTILVDFRQGRFGRLTLEDTPR